MNPEELPSVGEVLADKYRLTRELGRGGMGAVYEAEHLRLGQKVAIKVVLPEVAKRPELAYRFEHEGRAAAKLRGRHVVRVLDIDSTPDGLRYLVMELLEGRSLRDELRRRGPLPIAEAVRHVREACAGLSEVHRAGIVHRDVKPANLFLSEEEGGTLVKVVDFGIAKAHGDPNADYHTATNVPLGTYKYMSPEQARSARSVDARTDVWALGVTLYELLAGKAPFSGDGALGLLYAVVAQPPEPLLAARPDVPEALVAVVERALCKDVEGRYQSARDLSDALAPFEAGRLSPPLPLAGQPMSLPSLGLPIQLTLTPPRSEQTVSAPGSSLLPARPALREVTLSSREAGASQVPSRFLPLLVEGVPEESVTSGSKSHTVPISPAAAAAGRQASSPWFLRGVVALVASGGIGMGFQVARLSSAGVSLAPAFLAEVPSSEQALVRPAPAPAPTVAAAEPSSPAPAASTNSTQIPPKVTPEVGGGRARTPLPRAPSGAEGGRVAKTPPAPSNEPPARLAAKPPERSERPDEPAAPPALRPAPSASAKPHDAKERPDIERFDAL